MMEVMPNYPKLKPCAAAARILKASALSISPSIAPIYAFLFQKGLKSASGTSQSFARRAKYLLADMQDARGASFTWLSHLGMTGRFMLSLPQQGNMEHGAYAHEVTAQTAQKHIHVEIGFDDGTHLSFADPRRFGFALFYW